MHAGGRSVFKSYELTGRSLRQCQLNCAEALVTDGATEAYQCDLYFILVRHLSHDREDVAVNNSGDRDGPPEFQAIVCLVDYCGSCDAEPVGHAYKSYTVTR